jgi:clan AA aspartic protease
MVGKVISDEALFSVEFQTDADQPKLALEFVIDTGFKGYLTLPESAVEALQLPFFDRITANLADDSSIDVSLYVATILWHGESKEVPVIAMGKRPLLRTKLLAGSDLHARFLEEGAVTVQPV